jgi:hypothetical protein
MIAFSDFSNEISTSFEKLNTKITNKHERIRIDRGE